MSIDEKTIIKYFDIIIKELDDVSFFSVNNILIDNKYLTVNNQEERDYLFEFSNKIKTFGISRGYFLKNGENGWLELTEKGIELKDSKKGYVKHKNGSNQKFEFTYDGIISYLKSNRIVAIILILIVLFFGTTKIINEYSKAKENIEKLNGNSDNTKTKYLQQARISLEAEQNIAVKFNKRNIPLNELLPEAKIDLYSVDKNRFILIDSLTVELHSELTENISKINSEKSKSSDNSLYVATLDYLISIQDLENVITPFLESIKDSIDNNEQDLSVSVKTKALNIKYESDKWRKAESDFYLEHGIKQKDIDSITDLIKK